MTVDELKAKIEEAERIKAKLKEELHQRRIAERAEFVSDVRARADKLGMSMDDLIAALGGKRKAEATRRTRRPSPARILNGDPSRVYRGGALPGWMKDAMFDAGYPEITKNSTRAFIENFMQAAD